VNVLNEIVQDQLRTDLPEIVPGDTVKVSAKVVEGTRERIQVFEGLVMRVRRSGIASTITVRRIASGVGVERTFKLHSPRKATHRLINSAKLSQPFRLTMQRPGLFQTNGFLEPGLVLATRGFNGQSPFKFFQREVELFFF